MNIPQAEADIKGVAERSQRACARVIPTMVVQGMVWIWPDNSPEGESISSGRDYYTENPVLINEHFSHQPKKIRY